jgi:tRNA/tmRNA/rRNA uracil-C5-methylase (TrmA/RlmC/RlmD family)
MTRQGDSIQLTVEKPAAGGRMIARLNGQIVLVGGAIPGERVTARIERVGKGVVYADTVGVDDSSPDRRTVAADPLCGGCLYAHIDYARQLDLKAQVIADAFGRIGRLTLPSAVRVAASPEEGYRMRARLHIREGRAGFFREGTHDLCDARQTRQLLPATCDVLDRFSATLASLGLETAGDIDLSENVDASDRVVCIDATMEARVRERLADTEGLTGVGPEAWVTDLIAIEGAPAVALRRNVRSFFQGNRYLLNALVNHVVGLVPGGGDLLDLYAGSGLFSVAAAAVRGVHVTAVEGDGTAYGDLRGNASAHDSVAVCHQPVEAFLEATRDRPAVVIVDPPRTGMSRAARDGVVRLRARRLVYVSCDAATLARDSRVFVDAGYTIERVDAFDLFPNTPHVETVVVFTSP